MKKLHLFIGLALIANAASANSTSRDVDNGYAGLKWTFAKGFVPEIVVGYRHANVGTDGHSYGSDVSLSFQVWPALQAGKIRLKYFNGAEYLQGEVGVGYDFNKGWFAGIGGKAPFANAGVDFHFSRASPIEAYFMLDSLGQYQKPRFDFEQRKVESPYTPPVPIPDPGVDPDTGDLMEVGVE